MRYEKLFICVVLSLTTAALAVGEWERDDSSSSEDDGWVEADVGGVDGWVGALSPFTTSQQGSGYQTTGAVGTLWSGEQYDRVDQPSKVEKTNSVTHAYTRERDGTTGTVGVGIDSAVTVSGSARISRFYDPQWWWDTQSTIEFLGVSVRAFNDRTDEWEDLTSVIYPFPNWPSAGVNDGGAGAASDAKNNNRQDNTSVMTYVNPPTDTSDENAWAYETTDEMIKLEITAKWKSKGRPATVDNAIVNNERHQLSFTMTTSPG